MAMMRYSSATVVEPYVDHKLWEKRINHGHVICDDKECRVKTAKTILAKYSPKKYLLSHCFPAGHMVLMADGTERPIDSIQVGDQVITHRGNIRSVTKIMERDVSEDLITVKSASLPEISCTSEHPFYAIKKSESWCKIFPFYAKSETKKCIYGLGQICGKYGCNTNGAVPQWVTASKLSVGDKIYTPTLNELSICDDLNPNKMRLLGYYVAEGRVDKQKGRNSRPYMVRFALHDNEIGTLGKEISKLMEIEFGIKTHSILKSEKDGQGVVLSFHNFKAAAWFLRFAGIGSKTKKLSIEVMTAPLAWQRQFIGAWLNGDGHYDRYTYKSKESNYSSKGIRLSTASDNLMSQAVVLLDRLEIHSNVQKVHNPEHVLKEGRYIKATDIWQVAISKSYVEKLNTVVKWDVEGNQSKSVSTKQRYRYAASTISSITKIDRRYFSGKVYNFSVEEDESYIINRQAVHNCTIIAAVDTELANPADPKSDYYIHPAYSKFINNNGDAWSKQVLASCYHSFIGSNNYLEHVQIPELSKGKIIDAILREVPIGRDKTGKDITTYYVDILVATERKHKDLIRRIEAKELSTLSMGCKIAFSICSKCGKKAVDETEACQHVRFEKNNIFYDDNGVQRKVGELCGHFSEPESVTFIDASWVENPAFTGAVIRNIVNPPENIMAKLEEANKKDSYVIQDGDFLKAANKKAQDEDKPEEKDEPSEEPKDEPKEEEPQDEPAGAEEPAVEDNAAPGEEEGAPEEESTPAPTPEETPVKTWKKDIKKKLLNELSNDLIKEFAEETEGATNDLETLDEGLIQPTASSALRKMWLFKRGWENYLKKTAKNVDRESFNKLRLGTFMILTSNDLSTLAQYGFNRRDFLAVMSYIDQRFLYPLSLGIKKAIAELNGTKGLDLKTAIYSLQKLSSRKLNEHETRKALTWLKAMDFYSE